MAKGKRRADGEGSLWYHEDRKRWVAECKGQRKFAKTKSEAAAILRQLMKTGPLVNAQGSLAEWLETWLASKVKLAPGTRCLYEGVIRGHLLPAIPDVWPGGKVAMGKLNLVMLQKLITHKDQDPQLGPARIHHIRVVLSSALGKAAKARIIEQNFALDLECRPIEKRSDDAWPRFEQSMRLLERLKDHPHGCLFTMSLTTGMRRGEVLGVRWSDLVFDPRPTYSTVTVRQNLQYEGRRGAEKGRLYIKRPKSNKFRTIVLSELLVPMLKAHRTRQLEQRLKVGPQVWQGNDGEFADLVFTNGEGGPLWPDKVGKWFRRLRSEVGLDKTRLHDLRHGAASLALRAKANMKHIQVMMGHAKIGTTFDVYGHLEEEAQRQVAAQMDKLFSQQG